jgi:hypothetical protein
MHMRLCVILFGLAISFAPPAFAQVDPKIEQQIRALLAKFDEAFNRNDATGVAALYTEDGYTKLPWGGEHFTVGRRSKEVLPGSFGVGVPAAKHLGSIG